MKKYYDLLGIPVGASKTEVKQAYRKLASQHHPDKGGNTDNFIALQEAYQKIITSTHNRYQVPINNVKTVKVKIPLEQLLVSQIIDISVDDKIVEVSLPDWDPKWGQEHTFFIQDSNLKLSVEADTHWYFIKDESLHINIGVSTLELLCGTEFELPNTHLKIRVPRGIDPHDHITVDGFGFKTGNKPNKLTCIFTVHNVQLTDKDMELSLQSLNQQYKLK